MANSIASLFGPTAEEIVYAKQQQDMARRQAAEQQGMAMQSSPLAQQFYQSGLNITKGLGALFGDAPMQDPRLAQSIKIRQILGDADVNARSLDDLERFCKEEWLKIPLSVFSHLVKHYRRRLGAVLLAKGGCTKY